jgi:hypothetical protein
MQARRHKVSRAKGRLGVVAACALVACIPSAGLALGGFDGGLSLASASGTIAKFTPASIDPRIAQLVARSSAGKARLMRFTPAGVADRANRSVTVAVRVDEEAAHAITLHALGASPELAAAGAAPVLRIAPMRYNLGLARGYQSFAKATPPAPSAVSRSLSDAQIPDLATFKPAPGARPDDSRFTPRNTASEPRAAAAPRVVDAHEPGAEQAFDVAGSYRLTRNLDVTAGVRYGQNRDRLAPVVDTAKLDNQAVYIGTQFHF